MTDRILTYPDPRLRQKAAPVTEITPEIRERALGLVRLMNEEKDGVIGIGLAATQVGWPVRILACKWTDKPVRDWSECEDKILVNPVIESVGGPLLAEHESCLSLPGIRAKVERPFTVAIRGTTLEGGAFWHCSEGIVARLMQHELDHLDGVLFIDRLTRARRIAIQPQLRRLEGRS